MFANHFIGFDFVSIGSNLKPFILKDKHTMQISKMPVIDTVSDLESVYLAFCSGFRTEPAKNVPNVRFAKLSGEDKAILSDYTAKETFSCLVDFNVPGMIEYVLGLVESDGSMPLFATYDGKGYSAKRNTHNRKKTNSRIGPANKPGTYSNSMVRIHWITNVNDPGLVDCFGFVRSFQHRAGAIKLALPLLKESGGKLPLFPMVFGIPPQFSDMTDKAKSRTAKDDDYCDTEQFPYELIREVQTEMHGEPQLTDDLTIVRTKCIELRQKVLGTLRQRLRGSDISKTGDKLTDDEKMDLIDRLGGSDIVDRFIVAIYENQRSQSGKLDRQYSLLFSPAIVATGLILASNASEVIKRQLRSDIVREPDETPEQFSDRWNIEEISLLNGPIQIDDTIVELVLTALRESSSDAGPLQKVFSTLFDKKKNDKKAQSVKSHLYEPLSLAAMSAFVQLVKNIVGSVDHELFPDASSIDTSVWTVYRNISENPDTIKYGSEYRNFGGMDKGYTKRTGSKKSDE